jgi:hypothetical protein
MTRKGARAILHALERSSGYHAPADLRKAVLKYFRADRLRVDFSAHEARLRLASPLSNGVTVLKARSLAVAERDFLAMYKAAARSQFPWKCIHQTISIMNGVDIRALEGLGGDDAQILFGLAALLTE